MTDDHTRPPQVLAFDVFGTVVDWHGSVAREVNALYPGSTAMPSRWPGAQATSRPCAG